MACAKAAVRRDRIKHSLTWANVGTRTRSVTDVRKLNISLTFDAPFKQAVHYSCQAQSCWRDRITQCCCQHGGCMMTLLKNRKQTGLGVTTDMKYSYCTLLHCNTPGDLLSSGLTLASDGTISNAAFGLKKSIQSPLQVTFSWSQTRFCMHLLPGTNAVEPSW